MQTLPVIQSLWIGKMLSTMEKLCISSFLQNGHPFHLYIYDNVEGVPEGVTIKDASTILSPDKIFKYKDHDSYAGFANMFRYKLLLEKGNYWVDSDIICLKPFQHNEEYVFASERQEKIIPRKRISYILHWMKPVFSSKENLKATNCVIKAPPDSAIMDYCYNESANKDPETLKWGQTGPLLLTKAIKKFGMECYVATPEVFCPVNCWEWNQFFDESPDKDVLTVSQAVHLWNEMWRMNKIDKSGSFNENSIFEQLKEAYLGKSVNNRG